MKKETKKEAQQRRIAEKLAAKDEANRKMWAEINAHPVAIAVEPIKADAIARAEIDAKAYVEKLADNLAQHGWDLNSIAPSPYGREYRNISREKYMAMSHKRALYSSITVAREDNRDYFERQNDPRSLRDLSDEGVARFIQQAKDAAFDHYQSFVLKMVKKIGDVRTASLDGNHVWGFSVLTVGKPDGSIQKWKTQQIVNCSVYGLLFNQWPSRIIK